MHSVGDARRVAARRLPRMVMDFLEGGALDEITLRANRQDLDQLRLQQRVLRDVSDVDVRARPFGVPFGAPVAIAPMGLLTLFQPGADIALARAARAAGTVFVHSAWSGTPLADVAAAAPGSVWSQVAFWPDGRLVDQHLERAEHAGIRTLVVAADVSVSSKRERDLRNGFTMAGRPTAGSVLDALRHPGWLARFLAGPRVAFGDQTADGRPMTLRQMEAFMEHENASATWTDVAALRARWPGRIVVKGIMTPDDARAAMDVGADAIYVSNHGGRQFDAQPSTVAALPDVVAAVAGRAPVLVDGGVRRGSDVVKMSALGADLCFVGRPVVYGLVAGGSAGARRVLDLLTEETAVALAFTGTVTLSGCGPAVLSPLS